MLYDVTASLLIIVASMFTLATIIALYRAPDALTRANLMGNTTSVALPLILIASLINDIGQGDFSVGNLIRVVLTIAGLLVILAIGSFIMGRSLYETEE
ncbi:Na+/H+ antiporter subunit G [Corynebacterium kutscheri]|uniref:Na(+)/H(+) antiporter subunit G n=1 Tax=Corynebacterium kutscheri TaxID=35755 RepID=A0AB38VRF8_9CORY|nr:Na+/H+ antiporter subunit G [Corynebacterium kutscheri]VEH05282.1 Na(+)/H(+) antiporter subunit G [Corynebacterium kutscheri]